MLVRSFVLSTLIPGLILTTEVLAQDPILVDPKDFTRTPCEYRNRGCGPDSEHGATPSSPVPQGYTPIESGDVDIDLGDGIRLTVIVTLIEVATGTEQSEQRVVATYSTLARERRAPATREAIFARLVLVADAYEIDMAHVSACRSEGMDCAWSTFARQPDGEWSLSR